MFKRFPLVCLFLAVLISGASAYWWDADCTAKWPIQLPNGDLNYGETVRIPSLDYSSMSSANPNYLWIVDENKGVEVDRLADGSSAATDGNMFFRLPYPMPNADTNQNDNYFIYKCPASVGNPADANVARMTVQGFEPGEPLSTITDTGDENSTNKMFGDYSYHLAENQILRYPIDTIDGNNDFNYTFWVSHNHSGDLAGYLQLPDATVICQWSLNTADNVSVWAGAHTVIYAYSKTVWYEMQVNYNPAGSGRCAYTIFDATGTYLGSAAGTPRESVSVPTEIAINGGGGDSNAHSFVDNVHYSLPLIADGIGTIEYAPGTLFGGTADVNVWRIEGYDHTTQVFPIFTYSGDGNLVIDFNVTNTDNNRMHLDLNYSTSNTQGTGVVILDDFNLTAGVCSDQNFSTVSSCTWDWNISAIGDGNYFILMDVNSGGVGGGYITAFDVTDRSFEIRTPKLHLQFFDENKFNPIQGLSALFNNITYTTNANGIIDINATEASGKTVMRVWQDSNYGTRYFSFDVNATTDIDQNLVMLRDENGQDISFVFWDTDQTTLLGNAEIYVFKQDHNLVSQRTANSDAEVTFFLNGDTNYTFQIHRSNGTVVEYFPTTLTIKVPRDEVTLGTLSPFDVDTLRLGSWNWTNSAIDLTYVMLSNTVDYYQFDINGGGSTYYDRSYSINLKGNPATYILQPYLISTLEGISSIFTVRNTATSLGIPGIFIRSERVIPGGGFAIVETAETDSAGEAALSFVINDTYTISFFEGTTLRYTVELRPTATTYQVYLDLGTLSIPAPVDAIFDVNFLPLRGIAWILADGNMDFNQSISVGSAEISTLSVEIANGGTIVYSLSLDGNASMTFPFVLSQDLNAALLNRLAPVKVTVTITTTTGQVYVKTEQYSIQSTTAATAQLVPALLGVTLWFGDTEVEWYPATTIIAMFIALFAVAFAAMKVTTNSGGLVFLFLAVLGMFVFLSWVPLGVFVLACMAGIAIFVLTRRIG